MSVALMDALSRSTQAHADYLAKMVRVIEEDGWFYFYGRKVIMTYEDTGLRTNIKPSEPPQS